MDRNTDQTGKDVASAPRHRSLRDLMPWRHGDKKEEVEKAGDPVDSLQEAMSHLLEAFRRDFGWNGENGDLGVVRSRMDLGETDDAVEVTVELPGMDEKDIDVSVSGNVLTVRGEKKTEQSGKKKDYHYRECTYGSVERVVPLPDGVDTDRIAAKFRKGVLTVTMPKSPAAAQPVRKVEVKGTDAAA